MKGKTKYSFGSYRVVQFVELLHFASAVRSLLPAAWRGAGCCSSPFPTNPPTASPARSDCCGALHLLGAALRAGFVKGSPSPHSLFYAPCWAELIAEWN